MTVPRAMATAGTASHSVQRRTRRGRERLGGGACLRSLPCGLPCCWCLAARVGVIGGAAIARACYSNRAGKPISADVAGGPPGGPGAGGGAGVSAIPPQLSSTRAGKPISADVAAAQQVALGQVVPVAGGADLDHVA